MIALIFAAALLAGAEPPASTLSEASSAAPAAPAPAKGAKPKREDLVCRKEAVLGSRMPTRVCMTQEDWDQRRNDGRDELKKIQQGQPYEAR